MPGTYYYLLDQNIKEVCHGNNLHGPLEYSFVKKLIDTGETINGYSATAKIEGNRVAVRVNRPDGHFSECS